MYKETDLTEIRDALIQGVRDGTPLSTRVTPLSTRVERQIEEMCRIQEEEDFLKAMIIDDVDE